MTRHLSTVTETYSLSLHGWQVALIVLAALLVVVGLRAWRTRRDNRA